MMVTRSMPGPARCASYQLSGKVIQDTDTSHSQAGTWTGQVAGGEICDNMDRYKCIYNNAVSPSSNIGFPFPL